MSVNKTQTNHRPRGLAFRLENIPEDIEVKYPFTREEVFEAARKIKNSFSQVVHHQPEPVMLANVPFFVVRYKDIDSLSENEETSEKVLEFKLKDVHPNFSTEVYINQCKQWFFTDQDRYVDEKFFAFVMAARTLSIHRHPKAFRVDAMDGIVGNFAKQLLAFLGLEPPSPSLSFNCIKESMAFQENGNLSMTVSIRAKPYFDAKDYLNFLFGRRPY